jgi:hypothetical protein
MLLFFAFIFCAKFGHSCIVFQLLKDEICYSYLCTKNMNKININGEICYFCTKNMHKFNLKDDTCYLCSKNMNKINLKD